MGGSATNGVDYATLSGTATIPANAASTTLTITPLDDPLAEGAETVTVTVTAGLGYRKGSPGSATVTIADND
jgi:hypothetical protein